MAWVPHRLLMHATAPRAGCGWRAAATPRNGSCNATVRTLAVCAQPSCGSWELSLSRRKGWLSSTVPFNKQCSLFSSSTDEVSTERTSLQIGKASSLDHEKIPGVKFGGAKLAIMFTCTAQIEPEGGEPYVCGTRSAKVFTRQAYENGVVLVRCPGCGNQHLIADRLGWFEDDSWDVERLMRERGEGMVKLDEDGTLQILGTEKSNE